MVLYVGAGVLLALCIFGILRPFVRALTRPDPDKRAQRLLDQYYREKRELDPRHRDLSVPENPVYLEIGARPSVDPVLERGCGARAARLGPGDMRLSGPLPHPLLASRLVRFGCGSILNPDQNLWRARIVSAPDG